MLNLRHDQRSNLYPAFHTVTMCFGSSGRFSSFCRSSEICKASSLAEAMTGRRLSAEELEDLGID